MGCLMWVNYLAPGKFEWNFSYVIFKQILVIDGWGISCEIALILMSLDFIDDQSTLVQVMAWCHQATSHYLSQCWPRSLSPYGVTRPQWFKSPIYGEVHWSMPCLCHCCGVCDVMLWWNAITQKSILFPYIDGLEQDCSLSSVSVLAMEILQSYTKPSI